MLAGQYRRRARAARRRGGRVVLAPLRHTEAVFERALIRAQEAGEIPVDRDPQALARFLVNALHGLRVLARVGTDRAVLEDAVRVALDVLH